MMGYVCPICLKINPYIEEVIEEREIRKHKLFEKNIKYDFDRYIFFPKCKHSVRHWKIGDIVVMIDDKKKVIKCNVLKLLDEEKLDEWLKKRGLKKYKVLKFK